LRSAAPAKKLATETEKAEKKAPLRDKPRPVKNGAAREARGTKPGRRAASSPALAPIMRKEKQKLVRGRETIDARIDLHGMTQTEAHAALRIRLQRAQVNGAKFVLVITGKGLPNSLLNGRGVLRRQVPLWLAQPEFRPYVAGFEVASASHGGEGALYVRLRKAKGIR
jgi:DNA-nicking Smr family endonuclease